MMKTYTLIAIVSMSGIKAIKVGEEIPNLNAEQVLKLTKQGTAKFTDEKQHKKFIAEYKNVKELEKEKEAKVKAILKQSVLQNELNELYLATVLKEAELSGEVLSDEETLNAVETIAKRDGIKKKEDK